jgi:hypothetical protein
MLLLMPMDTSHASFAIHRYIRRLVRHPVCSDVRFVRGAQAGALAECQGKLGSGGFGAQNEIVAR